MEQRNPALFLAGIAIVAALLVFGVVALAHPDFFQGRIVPATAETPAHYALPAGAQNPAASLAHFENYSPSLFTLSAVGSSTVTGTFSGAGEAQTLRVTEQTEVYTPGARKSDQEFSQEMADFQHRIGYATSTNVYVAPDPYVHEPRTLADLSAGMTVVVVSDGESVDSIEILPAQQR